MKLLLSVAAALLSAGLANAAPSTDGTCGGTNGFTCVGSSFGNCCSQYGWCGSSTAHCGTGCNPNFGICPGSNPSTTIRSTTTLRTSTSTRPSSSSSPPSSTPTLKVSTDATCGGTNKFTCLGSSFGNCCSSSGWCGSTSPYCGTGCQSGFGNCGSNDGPSSQPPTTTKPTTSSTRTSSSSSTPSASVPAPQCLNAKNVPYKLASNAEYAELVEPYNLRLPYKPAVVVVPTTNQHVIDAVLCASQAKLKVQAKSGGHSYANFGNGGKDGSLIINLESFQNIQLDKNTGIVTVGGGVRLGNLADGIFTQNNAALAHGTCPGVGIGGHFTHGGYSHTSRSWGLAMDQIVGADVVLANGTLIKATSSQYPEIFWAIRGAAESFGIVTTFYLQTRAAPASVTWFSFPLNAVWSSKASFTNTFLHLQDVAKNASIIDNRISFGIYMDGGGSYSVSGAYFGTVDDFNKNIRPEFLRTLPAPTNPKVQSYSWYDFLVLQSGESTIKVPLTGYDEHENFFAKSITVPEADGLSANALNAFYDHVQTRNGVDFYVIINLYGGPGSAINTKDTNFAAYADRDSLWVFQNWGYATNAGAVSFINGLNSAIINAQPLTKFGAYLNYVDSSYSAATAHSLYYGDALYSRLLALKQRVDPTGLFWNPQAIGA